MHSCTVTKFMGLVTMLTGSLRSVRSLSTATQRASSSLSSLLQNPSLLPETSDTSGKKTFKVRNPADPDSVLARIPIQGRDHVRACIERSSDALKAWRDGTTATERSKLLTKWSRLIQENQEDIATIMTLESGKILQESRGEIAYGVSFVDYYAAEAVRPTSAGGGWITPTPFATNAGAPRGQVMAIQQAVGNTALITPWNFPIAMITRKVAPALAAGCTAIVKPSELTPLTALALQKLAEEAGIPEAVLQTVTPDTKATPQVGHELCTNPAIRKLSFTGSTHVGKLLMKDSSDTVKRLSLELGGNAPFVVFEDADIEQAVTAAMASKFRNAGQTCVCADRFLVHSAVHDEFVACFQERIEKELSNLGPGIDPATQMGPLISQKAVQSVHAKVEAAVDKRAKLLTGGAPAYEAGSQFYQATLLTNVSPDMDIWKTETFGPVAAVIKFDSEQEALELANDSRVGLASYFCTQDLSRAFRFAQRLESGLVGVNEGIMSTCVAPFGGVKESGLGREGSQVGIAEYLETKYIFMNT